MILNDKNIILHACTTCNLGNFIILIILHANETLKHAHTLFYTYFLHTSKAGQERESPIMTDSEGRRLSPLIDPDNTSTITNESSK